MKTEIEETNLIFMGGRKKKNQINTKINKNEMQWEKRVRVSTSDRNAGLSSDCVWTHQRSPAPHAR